MCEQVIMNLGQFRSENVPKVFVEICCEAINSRRFVIFHRSKGFFQFVFSNSSFAGASKSVFCAAGLVLSVVKSD